MLVKNIAGKMLAVIAALILAACGAVGQSIAQDRPLPPTEAPKAMTLPKGFQATLFAGS